MDQEFDFGDENNRQIVYVRPIAAKDLPAELRAQTGGLSQLYSVNTADGQQLALVANRKLAFALARQHDFSPVNVH